MIIGISGYAGTGKDTVGIMIQYLLSKPGKPSIEEVLKDPNQHEWWLEDQSGWEVKKFAGKLKDIASHLTGIDIEDFEDQEFKKTNLGPEWDVPAQVSLSDGLLRIGKFRPLTVREFLQNLGTNAMRNGLHDNVWVNALFSDYTLTEYGDDEQGHYPNWIITDVRFPNEAQAIKDKKGIIIRIDRPGMKPINDHPSEVGLDNWKFDYKIANVSDEIALMFTVENILKHAKILNGK
jgi:hypothetical protein